MGFKRRKQENKDREYERLVAEETLIFDVTEEISRALAYDGLSRTELAERLGKSKGFVTQLLSGERNMTLRTAADLAFALGRRFQVRAVQGDPPLIRPGQPYHRLASGEEIGGYRAFEREAESVFFFDTSTLEALTSSPIELPEADSDEAVRADHEFTLAS